MKPASAAGVRSAPEEARLAIERFLSASKDPVVIEPGDPPLPVIPEHFVLEWRAGNLVLEVWNDDRVLSRRISGIASQARGRLDLTVERFGKRVGLLSLVDNSAAKDVARKTSRLGYRERFRRALLRQFAGWRLAELSTEADLEHSLSPSYPRALIRKGAAGWAAIGASSESDIDGALTFGLIWLDYLRSRERRLTIEGLAILLPAGRERTTCLRLLWLNPKAAQFAAFAQFDDGYEDRVDLADYGNLETHLERCTRTLPDTLAGLEPLIERISSLPGVERNMRGDGSLSFRVRGLEFARAANGSLHFGLETRRHGSASNLREIVSLAEEIGRLRSPDAGDPRSLLYSRHPEGWLESQVRSGIQDIDATLQSSPLYGQAPAFAAGDRDLIDLLAVDHTGRLAVIELKASEDIHLPLQALDYWMRVRWHAARNEFGPSGYFPGVPLRSVPPRLLLVAPALDFHPSNETVLRYFSPSIEVERVGVGLEWRKQLKVMFRHGSRGQ